MKGHWLTFGFMIVVLASAVSLVEVRYGNRQSFVELGEAQKSGVEIADEHGRLQLEKGADEKVKGLTKVATDELSMHRPTQHEEIVLKR